MYVCVRICACVFDRVLAVGKPLLQSLFKEVKVYVRAMHTYCISMQSAAGHFFAACQSRLLRDTCHIGDGIHN